MAAICTNVRRGFILDLAQQHLDELVIKHMPIMVGGLTFWVSSRHHGTPPHFCRGDDEEASRGFLLGYQLKDKYGKQIDKGGIRMQELVEVWPLLHPT